MSKYLKRVLITLVLAAVIVVSAVLSACSVSTKHPRAKILIEFNGVSYELEYTLYRNMYPQTVRHFIELADSGFYNDMIVHDYTSNEWYTGGFDYVEDEGSVPATSFSNAYSTPALKEYLLENDKETQYHELFESGKITPSVYKRLTYDSKGKETVAKEDALPTLIGEFRDNDHNIKEGALTNKLGVLKMFYYDKGNDSDMLKVTIKNWENRLLEHDYKYNCATSIFTIQCSNSSSLGESKYCVFGQLRNDKARSKFEALLDDIEDYIESNFSGSSSSFTTTVPDYEVDNLDSFAAEDGRNVEVNFNITSKPIIIKSVKITKY